MKVLGLFLLTVGFLAGSLVAVQTEKNEVDWTFFVPAAAVAIVGVALSRLGTKRAAVADASDGTGVRSLREALDRVVGNVRSLDEKSATLDPYVFHDRIDELFVDDLTLFADQRKQIILAHDLQVYAEVMNEFAAGERYLNRVWSASVDGYIDEIALYLGKARHQFERTQEILRRVEAA